MKVTCLGYVSSKLGHQPELKSRAIYQTPVFLLLGILIQLLIYDKKGRRHVFITKYFPNLGSCLNSYLTCSNGKGTELSSVVSFPENREKVEEREFQYLPSLNFLTVTLHE